MNSIFDQNPLECQEIYLNANAKNLLLHDGILTIDDIEESAWAEYANKFSAENVVCPSNTHSTENSVEGNNGSFIQNHPDSSFDLFQEEKLEGSVGTRKYSGKQGRKTLNKNVKRNIVEGWMVLRKLFIKYISSKKAFQLFRQEVQRKNPELQAVSIKESFVMFKALVKKASRKRILCCLCPRNSGNIEHTGICDIFQRYLRWFLRLNIRHSVIQQTNLSLIKKQIILEIGVRLERRLRSNKKN